MRKAFLLVVFSFALLSVQAAIVDTVWIESKAMKKIISLCGYPTFSLYSTKKALPGNLPITWLRWLVCQLDYQGAGT